jgi:hypothetical protein
MDDRSNTGVEGVMIWEKPNTLAGISDETGLCKFTDRKADLSIVVRAIGLADTLITGLKPGASTIRLHIQTQLQEVQIQGKPIDPRQYLNDLLAASLPKFLDHEDTFYYHYAYRLVVPDSNWQEVVTGDFGLPLDNYDKHVWRKAFYTSVYYKIDSALLQSSLYEKMPGNRIPLAINSDPMLKGRFRSKINKQLDVNLNHQAADHEIEFDFKSKHRNENSPAGSASFKRDSSIQQFEFYDQAYYFLIKGFDIQYAYRKFTYRQTLPRVLEHIYAKESYKAKNTQACYIEFQIDLLPAPPPRPYLDQKVLMLSNQVLMADIKRLGNTP